MSSDERPIGVKVSFQTEIRSVAERREVNFLLHFTQVQNLRGIVTHGILPRRDLLKPEYSAYASDRYRLDENDEAVSVSISRVNERMFVSKRHKSGHSDWVILVLSSEILWTHNCQFCWRNAATSEIRDHRGWRGGPWAFAEMFAGSKEARSGLPHNYPTDPEAEVQVLDRIAPSYILGAVVDRTEMIDPVQIAISSLPSKPLPVVVDASLNP